MSEKHKVMPDHHKGLPNNQVRDLIAKQIRDPLISGFYGESHEKYRAFLEEKVKKAKEELEGFNRGSALRQICDEFGWLSWDIENYVEYNKDSYYMFIGTEEEFKKFFPEYLESEFE